MHKWMPPRLGQKPGVGLAAARLETESCDGLRPYLARPATLVAAQMSGRDIGFCSDLASRGGTDCSSEGFTAERELFRLHEAGLIDLYRQNEQPFLIVKMSLSAAALRLVNGSEAAPPAARPSRLPAAAPGDGRRQAFEVARAMIGVAVRAELAAWRSAHGATDAEILERRMMARIDALAAPYPT
jgi:hypothetical protein